MSDFKRSLKESSSRMAAGVLGQVINTFGQLAVVPLFLHFWTKRSYGEWIVLTSVPNLLWSLEGGLAVLASNRMVLSSAVGDWTGANKLFQNIFLIQVIVSSILLGLGIVFIKTVNFLPLLSIGEMTRSDASFILVVMLIYMLLGWCVGLLRSPYFAAKRATRGFMMINFWRLSDFLVICLMLILHGHGRSIAVGEAVVAGAWVIIMFIDIKKICPQFQFGIRDVSWEASKSVFHDGMPLFLNQAGTAFFIQGYPLVLSRTLGPLAVVNFTAIRTVTRAFLQGIAIISSAASIELATSFATKNWTTYLKWVKTLGALILVGGACTCCALLFLGPSLIAFWTHGKVSVGGELLFLFGISVTIQAAWGLFGTLLNTANKHHLQCCIYFAITVAALIVGNFTIGRFGFGFVPLLMIVADLLVLISSVFLSVRQLQGVEFGRLLDVAKPVFYREKVSWLFNASQGMASSWWNPDRSGLEAQAPEDQLPQKTGASRMLKRRRALWPF